MTLACSFALGVTFAATQDYPTRPIRIIVGFAPGGGVDTVARLVGQEMSKSLGQSIVVENRPGAAGTIGAGAAARSEPDGYTLVMLPGGHALYGATHKSLPFDTVNGFEWISTIVTLQFLALVRAESGHRSMPELDKVADEIRARHGVTVTTHPADLADGAQVRRVAAACREVDILVNSAGGIPRGTLVEIDEDKWRRSWDLKVFGCINLTREIYGPMCRRGKGVIINIVGLSGDRPDAYYIAGSSANAALIMFSRSLGGEVSSMVVFLASDHASYISGSAVTIDGGLLSDSAIGVRRG
jgi:hypothetical protein